MMVKKKTGRGRIAKLLGGDEIESLRDKLDAAQTEMKHIAELLRGESGKGALENNNAGPKARHERKRLDRRKKT